jgi:hypothetical protein
METPSWRGFQALAISPVAIQIKRTGEAGFISHNHPLRVSNCRVCCACFPIAVGVVVEEVVLQLNTKIRSSFVVGATIRCLTLIPPHRIVLYTTILPFDLDISGELAGWVRGSTTHHQRVEGKKSHNQSHFLLFLLLWVRTLMGGNPVGATCAVR